MPGHLMSVPKAGHLVRSGLPCPSCTSSDAVSIYHNESDMWKCFSCGKSGPVTEKTLEFFEEQTNNLISRPKKRPLGLLPEGEFIDLTNPEHPWGFRGISARVCERYDIS